MDKIESIVNENKLALSTFIVLTRTYHDVHQRELETITNSSLTIAQFAVLEVLYTHRQLTIGEIIKKNLTTSGNMTVVINNLEKKNYIKKIIHPEDKRYTYVELTEKGYEIMQNILPQHFQNIIKIMDELSDEEKRLFKTLLKKLSRINTKDE